MEIEDEEEAYPFDTTHFFGEGLELNDNLIETVTAEANRLVPKLNELHALLHSDTVIPEDLHRCLRMEYDAMRTYFYALQDRLYEYYPLSSLWLKGDEELEVLSKKELCGD